MNVAELVAKLSLKSDHQSFKAGEELIHGVHHLLAEFLAFETVKKVGEFFVGIIEGATETAVHFERLAQKTGISTDVLQGLAFVAKHAGLEIDSLATGLKRLAVTTYAAHNGSKQARETFKHLGIAFNDAHGKIRPIDALLGDLADRFHKMPDGTQKTAEAVKLLGRAGSDLIPALNGGRDGIQAVMKKAKELGLVFDHETIEQFHKLHETTIDLQGAWQGIKNQIAIGLIPIVNALAQKIEKWVEHNRELIKEKVQQFIEKLVVGIQKLWEVLVKAWSIAVKLWPTIVSIGHAIKEMVGWVGGAENAVRLLIAAWIAFKALQLGGFLLGLAQRLTAFAAASTAAGSAGGMAASAIGAGGLVVAAAAAGYAFGTLIDKVFDLSGKLSNLMVDMFGPIEHEATKNDTERLKKYEGMSDYELETRRHADTPEGRAAAQVYAARSAARDTRPMSTATRPRAPKLGEHKTTTMHAETHVKIDVKNGDPKEIAKHIEKSQRKTFKELYNAHLREASAATGGAE